MKRDERRWPSWKIASVVVIAVTLLLTVLSCLWVLAYLFFLS